MGLQCRGLQRIALRSCFRLSLGLGTLASGLASAAAELSMTERPALDCEPIWQLVQAPSADTAWVAVAGQRLSVRAAPRGNSPIVDHVEKGTELLVIDTQSQWAKVEDYQSGRGLGWVYESLLVDPGG